VKRIVVLWKNELNSTLRSGSESTDNRIWKRFDSFKPRKRITVTVSIAREVPTEDASAAVE
jgi:hypothetical protein